MAIASRGAGEFSATVRAGCLGGDTGLFSLVTEQIAEGRELTAVAAMLPALGLGLAVNHPHIVAGIGLRAHRSRRGTGVHAVVKIW